MSAKEITRSQALCPTCRRPPSERVGAVGVTIGTKPGEPMRGTLSRCADPVHDLADAAPEANRVLPEGYRWAWAGNGREGIVIFTPPRIGAVRGSHALTCAAFNRAACDCGYEGGPS